MPVVLYLCLFLHVCLLHGCELSMTYLCVRVFFVCRSKGCGIVEYMDIASAQHAIALLNNSTLKGRPIFVREDREEKKMF